MEPKIMTDHRGRILGGLLCALLTLPGCQSLSGPFGDEPYETDPNPIAQAGFTDGDATSGSVSQVAAEESLNERIQRNTASVMNFITFKEQQSVVRAKELYQTGDQLFRKAESQPREQAQKTFAECAEYFGRAAEAAPKTALEQDALFMQGESLFFADRLREAADTYQRLQKEYPRNRHLDKANARLFAVSRYWVDVAKTEAGKWFTLNLTDAKRPRLDVDGHAIRVLDQIRFDDPTGRLADDATMAAAAEYIRQQKFEEADEFLTDLRETFSDSEHLFHAHLLGIKCKLESYAGPAYSGLVLEEAEKLVKQTRQRFPDKLSEEKYGEIVANASAEIARHRADRLAFRAKYREDRKEYGAARYYYNRLLERFGNTPHAETARTRLAVIEKLPAVPTQRLSWLTTIFPDSRSKDPLQTTTPTEGQAGETILR
jgi:outer membrane protein assembly factor BamD (BamD/ComL family)